MSRTEDHHVAPTTLVAALVVVSVVYHVLKSLLAWYRLRRFPGPILASFSYLWLGHAAISGKVWKLHMATNDKYGSSPLIRVGPDILSTNDPEILRHINGARTGYHKATWYEAMRLDPYVHSMISCTDTVVHDDIKSRTAAGYSGKDVPSLEKDLDEQILNLKNLIRRKYLSGPGGKSRPMEFSYVAQYFTLDVLTKVAFGKEFGHLEADADVVGS
jgi:hypothetical protein